MVTLKNGRRVDEEMLHKGLAVVYRQRGAKYGDGKIRHYRMLNSRLSQCSLREKKTDCSENRLTNCHLAGNRDEDNGPM